MKKQLHFGNLGKNPEIVFFENKKGYFNKALTFMIIFN